MPIDPRRYALLGGMAAAASIAEFKTYLVDFAGIEFNPQSVVVLLFRKGVVPALLLSWIPDKVLRQTFDTEYFKFGHLLDPFAQAAARERSSSAYRVSEIAPDRFEASEYYATYYRKTAMVDEIGALRRLDDRSIVHLSLGRNRGYRKFSPSEIRKFKAMYTAIMPKLGQLAMEESIQKNAAPPAGDLIEILTSLNTRDEPPISRREAQIAALIIQGHSSRSIALHLRLSVHTVKVHRRNIYRKLTISAQNELFGLVMRHGMAVEANVGS
ncbi:MAG: LuxR C-terminal-related transcriptional regulator [Albidovulum sp.]|uniref:helix-turn-helix transcriptional regulator n=1 Tax=Albidovulum sp. TaxID=1872424 RepID=UPI003CA75BE3